MQRIQGLPALFFGNLEKDLEETGFETCEVP